MITPATITLVAALSGSVTITKPLGSAYGLNVGWTLDGFSLVNFAIVDNGNGTITVTANLSAAATGTIDLTIYDK